MAGGEEGRKAWREGRARPGRGEENFDILPPPALIEIAFPAGNHAHKPKISATAAGNFRTIILVNLPENKFNIMLKSKS